MQTTLTSKHNIGDTAILRAIHWREPVTIQDVIFDDHERKFRYLTDTYDCYIDETELD
jgi:hypothetical protein